MTVKNERPITYESSKVEIEHDFSKLAGFGEAFTSQANKILTNCKLMTEKLAAVSDIVRASIGIIETKTRLLISNLEARMVKAEADHGELQGYIVKNTPLMKDTEAQCDKLQSELLAFDNFKPLKRDCHQPRAKICKSSTNENGIPVKARELDAHILDQKVIKSFEGAPELCMVSSNKDYACLSTQESSSIYHITAELQFKPVLKMDTGVRVFDVQADRAICDENVLKMSENHCSEMIQTLGIRQEPLSMLTVGDDILLIGLPTYR